MFDWDIGPYSLAIEGSSLYAAHFHEYLVRGGYPQTVGMETIAQAQQCLRDTIINLALKADMTSIFAVRHVEELEQLVLYLCMHHGEIIDMQDMEKELPIKRPTLQHFIAILEAAHLIHRLPPFGYGSEVQRARYKIYIADTGLVPALMYRGKAMIDDTKALSIAAETSVINHLLARYYYHNKCFSYVREGSLLVAEIAGQMVPFAMKYQQHPLEIQDLKELTQFCRERKIERGYVVTRSLSDFDVVPGDGPGCPAILRIPATLLCYFLGKMGIFQ